MSIYLHTFDGNSVQAVNDARLYQKLTNNACGIVEGAAVTLAGGLILRVAAGWGIVNGRLFTINAEDVTAEAASGSNTAGVIYLHFDTTDTESPAKILTATGTSAADIIANLTFDDITGSGTENNIVLASYTVSAVAASELQTNDRVSISPAAGAGTIGGTAQPVYLNNGTLTALSNTVGSATRPVYLNNGTLTRGTYTIASVTTLPESPDANTIYLVTE